MSDTLKLPSRETSSPRDSTSIHHDTTRAPDTTTTPSQKSTPQDDAEFEAYNIRSPAFWLVVISIYLAFFLIGMFSPETLYSLRAHHRSLLILPWPLALDRMIIATAIPAITNSFGTLSDIGWYASAYMMTCAIFNPLFGSIYRFYSVKWVFMGSVVLFEVGSAICGAAPTSSSFIAGRAIAGVGAAGISSGAIMIIVGLVPLHKRPVFTSFLGMAFGVSSVLGPVMGGVFTDSPKLTWRWCFYINLPIGAFTLLCIFFFLHLPPPPHQQHSKRPTVLETLKRLDPLGLLCLVPSLVCLILALEWGGTKYSWSSAKVIGLLVTFSVTFLAFLAVEYKFPDTAMAPPRVVLNRSVGSSMFFSFTSAGGMMCAVYYLAIWFQAAQGQSAKEAGIRSIPMVASLILCGIVAAIITQKIGYYVPALLVAPVLASIGSGLLSTLGPHSSSAAWVGFQIIYGLGVGSGAQSASMAAQTVLPREDVPLGTAMNFFVQQLGGAVFVPVGQNLFSTALVKKLSGVSGLDTAVILNTGATDLRKVVPGDELAAVVDAFSWACTRVFILGAALSACMMIGALGVEWKSIKKASPDAKEKVVDGEKA